MDEELIREKLVIAQKISKEVEKELQKSCFEIVLSHLLRDASQLVSTKGNKTAIMEKHEEELERPTVTREETLNIVIGSNIDISNYTRIREKGKLLDKSLMVLKLVGEQFPVQELTPTEIEKILKGNFGLDKIHKENISTVLKKELGRMVQRRKIGKEWAYSILPKGVEFVDNSNRQLKEEENETKLT
ncbi:MAG: hypothetical protein Q8O10_11050 [candidate division Zixibacteria bacterium]|nr:hypothetical protein [candidate division Zixibacteria bacterium]